MYRLQYSPSAADHTDNTPRPPRTARPGPFVANKRLKGQQSIHNDLYKDRRLLCAPEIVLASGMKGSGIAPFGGSSDLAFRDERIRTARLVRIAHKGLF